MAYSDKTFKERFETMGDPCEDAFRRWAPTKKIRFADYGLKRPPFLRFHDLSEMVKATPDFVCEGAKRTKFFVECKGTGGRVLKIKLETMRTLQSWQEQMPVYFFVFDSNNKRCSFLSYRDMQTICETCKVYTFQSDNKEYYSISATKLLWTDIGDLYEQQVIGY